MNRSVPIGIASRESGIKVPTIRFYEQIGLLSAPPRTESNRRLYDEDDLRRLRFIRHARELGFEIEPIRQLIALAGHQADDIEATARTHMAEIDHKIARLSALRDEVCRVATRDADQAYDCRVIEVLGDHDKSASATL